ncbi:uncharacterized protein LOC135342390 isoform X3 [Halichondria panicea]|uniref:uncharacterized protein LOC135342390 isoform X3 n=1 Tax=Halichondria panicea TaxID=6063 RepID=UPI00312B5369
MGSQGLVALVTAVAFILSHTVIVLTASEFTMQPVSVVQAQRVDAVFECRYTGAQSYNWRLNGEFPTEDTYPPGVTATPSTNDTPATLTIPAIAHYNNTVVQCEAVVRDGRALIPTLSVNATLHLQGLLPAVADLAVNNVAGNCSQLNVTWDAPFSLNLTTAEPDIQYCVDVYNFTEDNLLQSECNITTTQHLFDIAYPMGTYSFSVTPRSNIDGSLNGSSSTGQFSYEPQAIPSEKVNFTTTTELSPLRVTFPLECRVPDIYSVHIKYIDREGLDLCFCSTDQSTEGSGMIVLNLNCSSCSVERHRRCSLIVKQQNTQSAMTMNISTHDVYKVTNLNMEENEVSITVDYLPQSNDTGFVAIVYSVDTPYDLRYKVVYRDNTSSTVGNLADRVYKLAVFDLNDVTKPERKLVFPAVLPNTILDNTRYGATEPSTGGEDMNATEVNRMICISCRSSCVGIIHSQSGIDQDNITLIPRTVTDSGQNCTESMLQGIYFAAIFKLMSNRLNELPSYNTMISIGSPTSTTASDAHTPAVETAIVGGIVVAATVTVVLIAFLVVIVFVWRRKTQEKHYALSTSLLENVYDVDPPLNREYSIPSEAAGGPPPIPYENVELMSLTGATEPPVSIDEPPPSYNAAATSKPFKQPHDQSVESTLKDPVYDVANSSHSQNKNKTEIPVVYADLDVKPKANSTPPMQHPVVYALIDECSLAPRSVENNTPCPLPSLSPPPTAESVLAEIYPIGNNWEALGEALGIKEHHLDSFSTEGHEQVCLHDMILYYFTFGPRSWEDIVKALWEIGETEVADKIIRSGKCTVELPVTSPTETPPPLPPRNDTAKAASHQTEAGDDWQDDSAQESDTLNTKEHQVTQQCVQHSADDQGELDEYNSGVHFPRSTGVGNKSEDGPTGRKNNSLASTLNTINKMPYFPTICKSAVHDPIPDKEESTVPYCTTMIHSLGVFEKLDVPRNHKVRALGYLNSGQSALLKTLYQQRMAAADEVHENNVSHVVPQNDDTAIENNGYTVKQSVSSIPLLTREETVTRTPNTSDIQSTRVRDFSYFPFHPTTWAYFQGVCFKGVQLLVQLLEHGCIFQPENLSCILFYRTIWAYLRGVRFKGVQLLEHGCIFQPEIVGARTLQVALRNIINCW